MKISSQKAGQVVKKNGCQEIEFRQEKLNLWDKLKSQTCEESLIEEVIATSRATIFRWKKLLKEYGCEGLESASRRPDRVRQAVKQKQLEPLVFKLRQKYPLFGKHKIRVMLFEEYGIRATVSTIGIIISSLIKQHRIQHSYDVCGKRIRKARRFLGHSQRIEYGMRSRIEGELLQIDHMTVGLYKHFSASCPTSKMSFAYTYRQATAATAADFLDKTLLFFPFAIKSIQVDGGSEFMADFEHACKRLQIPLYVLPPRSPKINGTVERSNGTYRYEFYAMQKQFKNLTHLNQLLIEFCLWYNEKRPHQHLNYSTPVRQLKERKVLHQDFILI
jgi:putative transposase